MRSHILLIDFEAFLSDEVIPAEFAFCRINLYEAPDGSYHTLDYEFFCTHIQTPRRCIQKYQHKKHILSASVDIHGIPFPVNKEGLRISKLRQMLIEFINTPGLLGIYANDPRLENRIFQEILRLSPLVRDIHIDILRSEKFRQRRHRPLSAQEFAHEFHCCKHPLKSKNHCALKDVMECYMWLYEEPKLSIQKIHKEGSHMYNIMYSMMTTTTQKEFIGISVNDDLFPTQCKVFESKPSEAAKKIFKKYISLNAAFQVVDDEYYCVEMLDVEKQTTGRYRVKRYEEPTLYEVKDKDGNNQIIERKYKFKVISANKLKSEVLVPEEEKESPEDIEPVYNEPEIVTEVATIPDEYIPTPEPGDWYIGDDMWTIYERNTDAKVGVIVWRVNTPPSKAKVWYPAVRTEQPFTTSIPEWLLHTEIPTNQEILITVPSSKTEKETLIVYDPHSEDEEVYTLSNFMHLLYYYYKQHKRYTNLDSYLWFMGIQNTNGEYRLNLQKQSIL